MAHKKPNQRLTLTMLESDCNDILRSPALDTFETDLVKEQCKKMIAQLSEEELELAAQSSYAYWKYSQSCSSPSSELRKKMAMREANRYFLAANRDQSKALEYLRKTCTYRQETRVDILRACFDKDFCFANEQDRDLAATFRARILQDTASQPIVVHGRDKADCAILRIGERHCSKTDDQEFLTTQLYMVERALAATEANSMGCQDMMVVFLDAGCFQSKCAPSRTILKELISILQNHYPQRLKTLLVLDPPLWLRSMYAVLSPALDKRTRQKFQMAKGKKAKRRVFGEIVKEEESDMEDELDLRQYTSEVPFHCSYDEYRQRDGSFRETMQQGEALVQ